jgi:hypothetical protein
MLGRLLFQHAECSVCAMKWNFVIRYKDRVTCEFMEFAVEEGYPPSSMTLSPDMDSSDDGKNGGGPEMR